jgi:NitT/TauT family transport system permease protein
MSVVMSMDGQTVKSVAEARAEHLDRLLTPPRPSFFKRYESWIIPIVSLAIGFAIWEWVTQARLVKPTLLAGPSQILGAIGKMASTGMLWKDLSYSGLDFILGFLLAVVVGIPLGLLLGTQRRAEMALTPYVMGFNSIPRLSFLTLLIVWFGLGLQAKVVLIFLSAVFPIIITTWAGVRVVDPVLLRAGRAYGAHGWQLFRRVIIPYSLPFIVSGLRLGVSHALIGVFASEIFGTDVGIGYRIISSGSTFDMPNLFAAVLILATFGVLTTQALDMAEHRIAPWRYAQAR